MARTPEDMAAKLVQIHQGNGQRFRLSLDSFKSIAEKLGFAGGEGHRGLS